MRFLLGWAIDIYTNLRCVIAEAVKEIGYAVDDALDVWPHDEED